MDTRAVGVPDRVPGGVDVPRPGAGQPGVTEWPEIYRKIRDAGKLIQFFTSQDPLGWRALEVIANQLGSAKGILMIGEAPAEDELEVRELIRKYGVE